MMQFNAGMGELLDSGTLDGMLDSGGTSSMHPARPEPRHPRFHFALLLFLLQHTTHTCNVLHALVLQCKHSQYLWYLDIGMHVSQ